MNHMHLRSGTSIAFGSIARSKVSTQASGTQPKNPLTAIEEDTPSTASESSSHSTSETSETMEGFQNLNLDVNKALNVDAASLGYSTRLIFICENRLGAKLYIDPLNKIAVKIEDIPMPTEAEVWVRPQGDQYMSIMGIRYLITTKYENMDSDGNLHVLPHVRTFSEPMQGVSVWSAGWYSPSAAGAGQGASLAPVGGANWTNPLDEASEEVRFSFPSADPNLTETMLYRMHVYKIENDSEFVALYTTQKGTVFKTMMAHGFPYSNEQDLNVYGTGGLTDVDIRDAWGNKYYKIEGENLRDFTRMGIPLFPFRPHTPGVGAKRGSTTVGPEYFWYDAPTPKFGKPSAPPYFPSAPPKTPSVPPYFPPPAPKTPSAPPYFPPYGDIDTGMKDYPWGPKPKEPLHGSADTRIKDHPWVPRPKEPSHGDKPKSKMGETGTGKPPDEPAIPKGKPKFPKPRPRGKKEESGSKNIRPTTLQKFCKKFDGTRDPYEHVALFNQLIYAEGVTDVHTKVHGFGLTLSESALSWFETLKAAVLYDFDILIKKFIEAHTKIGIRHSTVTLILNFKQGDRETVRQSVDQMKQYIARCPELELPKQERLVSCFLEGLLDEDLYMLLFAQDHKDFEFCCFEAQRLDDNRKGKGRSYVDEQRLDSSSQGRRNEEVVSHTIAEKVARLLKHENRVNQQYRPYQPTQPLRENPLGALKWCEPCRRWGNHSTNECYSKQRYMREVGATKPGDFKPMSTQSAPRTNKVARPVLGAQPAPPGTTPFHYVHNVEDSGQSLELVPSGPYYDENQDSMQLAISQLTDLDTSIVQLPAQALYMLANGGYRP